MTPLIVSKNPNGSIRWSFVWPKDEPCPQTLQIASEGLTLFVFSHREPKGREEWYVYRALRQEEIKQVSLKRGTTLLLMKQSGIVLDNWNEPKEGPEYAAPNPHSYEIAPKSPRRNRRRRAR